METNWNEKLQKAASFGIVILGNILYALAVRLFLMPAGLLTGGTTGIGLALNRAFGIPVSSFVLVFNDAFDRMEGYGAEVCADYHCEYLCISHCPGIF